MLGLTWEKPVSASMQACHIVCLCEHMGMIAMILNTCGKLMDNQGFLAKRLHHSTCIIEAFATRSNCWLCEISDKVYIIHITTYPINNVSEMWVYILAPNTHVIAAIREDLTFLYKLLTQLVHFYCSPTCVVSHVPLHKVLIE